MLNSDLHSRQVAVLRRVAENNDHPVGDDVGSVAHRVNGAAQFGLTRWSADEASALVRFHPFPRQGVQIEGPQLTAGVAWPHRATVHVNLWKLK